MIDFGATMILRARLVLPVTGPVIEDGAVLLRGSRVRAVIPWKELSPLGKAARVADLGETIVMPGLVNAHCHLDYTNMAGHFPPPKHFTDWLKVITEAKSGWSHSDFAHSWITGARMLARTGTTTVADIEATPELLPDVWNATPLRVFSFLELIGITGRRSPEELVGEALRTIVGLPLANCQAALSPHAPYSTLPDLLKLCARTSARKRWPVPIHLAESAVEYEMFRRARGPMYDWIERSGRDMSDCGKGSPVEHLRRCGLLNGRLLAVHVNYLGRSDARLLGGPGVNVVHCPRSHEYFGHDRFPWQRLARAGANLCLGTDSLASVLRRRGEPTELNMFQEMRCLARHEPGLTPRTITRMATVNAAAALGRRGRVGELSTGACADLIAIPFKGAKQKAWDGVLEHHGAVSASLINGLWAVPPATGN